MEAPPAIEKAVRTPYGRVVVYLAARSRDVAGAEDALIEALDDSRPRVAQSRQRGRTGGRIGRR